MHFSNVALSSNHESMLFLVADANELLEHLSFIAIKSDSAISATVRLMHYFALVAVCNLGGRYTSRDVTSLRTSPLMTTIPTPA